MAKDPTPNEPEKASQPASSHGASSPNFHPDHITLDTFHRLLHFYPVTVEAIARRKAVERAARASSAAAKRVKRSKSGSSAREQRDAVQTEPEQEQVDREVRAFLSLDERRYRGLPEIVRKRADDDGDGGGFLTKDELVEVMEWKLKHGVSRPMLLGMVKGNPDKVVQRATAEAFAAISGSERALKSQGNVSTEDVEAEEFPKSSLEMLTGPLRGVGPATASLLLSVGTGARDTGLEVPFYSDDTFLWLCLGQSPSMDGVQGLGEGLEGDEGPAKEKKEKKKPRAGVFKPNGEINVKYNVQEYRQLWDAVRELRKRLNSVEAPDGRVSCADVEKVALVLRHIDVSGFFETETKGRGSEDRKRKRDGKT